MRPYSLFPFSYCFNSCYILFFFLVSVTYIHSLCHQNIHNILFSSIELLFCSLPFESICDEGFLHTLISRKMNIYSHFFFLLISLIRHCTSSFCPNYKYNAKCIVFPCCLFICFIYCYISLVFIWCHFHSRPICHYEKTKNTKKKKLSINFLFCFVLFFCLITGKQNGTSTIFLS